MNNSIVLFLNLGTPEVMLIVFVALLLFGGKKLPELARGLGKGIREFNDASEGVKREIHRNINSVSDDLDADVRSARISPPTSPEADDNIETNDTETAEQHKS